jgi:hypothetical protein
MTRSRVAIVAVVACSAAPHNPPVLWLGLDGAEINPALLDHEPPPF